MLRRKSYVLSFIAFAFCLLIIGQFFSACSSCSKETKKKAVQRAVEKVDLSNTLVTRIPTNSFGFVRWDGNHEAYKRLMESPWGGSGKIMSVMESSDNPVSEIYSTLSKVGLSPADTETWRKLFSEAAFFAVPPAQSAEEQKSPPSPSVGVVFRPKGVDLSKKIEEIKTKLGEAGVKVTDVSIGGAEGLSLPLEGEAAEKNNLGPFYLVAKDGLGVIGSDQSVVEQVITSEGKALPALAQGEQFERSVAGFPGTSSRYAIGYFDLKSMFEGYAGAAQKDELEKLAVEAVTFALSMDKSPETEVRLVYDRSASGEGSWFNALQTSRSSKLLSVIPANPLAFLSVDGKTLRKIRELVVAQQQQQGAPQVGIVEKLSFLDATNRLGVVARLVPPGQSILPLPDLMLALETAEPEKALAQIEELVDLSVKSNPAMAQTQWVEKDLGGGTMMKSMMSPLGFGIFLAAKGDVVLVASTENQIRSVFSGGQSGTFSKSLSGEAADVFASTATVGNLYLNFQELGSFLENMGGLLSMYAPQNQQAGEFLQPDNIQSLKKMGTMIGSLTIEEGVIGMRSFYEVGQG